MKYHLHYSLQQLGPGVLVPNFEPSRKMEGLTCKVSVAMTKHQSKKGMDLSLHCLHGSLITVVMGHERN